MKIIIAGGRDFKNLNLLTKSCDMYLSKCQINDIEIVSGTANGADSLGEEYAKLKGFKCKQFPAEWDKYGKGAGFKRNCEMANYSDALIAFWDGISKGTKHMINTAKKKGIQVKIVNYISNE
jgi:hypothetical protein